MVNEGGQDKSMMPQLMSSHCNVGESENMYKQEAMDEIEDKEDGPRHRQVHFEGGEQEEEEKESELSIDTNLFLDEKKELIEERNSYSRTLSNILLLLVNVALLAAVLYFYIRDGYYNLDNYYIWIVAFFGSQVFAFAVTDMLVLFLLAKIVAQWAHKRKVVLASLFRESLYIYEDYRYVVQFVQTKIC